MKKIYKNLIDIKGIIHNNFHLNKLYKELRIYSKYGDDDDFYLRPKKIPECTFISMQPYKKYVDIEFETEKESFTYYRQYEAYVAKKMQEEPPLTISCDNYRQLKKEWEIIKVQKPRWVIFCLDDSQKIGTVTLETKKELSPQDLEDIAREDKRCDRWEKAKNLFNKDHDIFDDIWRSPADNDFNADIEKYLDRTEGFILNKSCSKAEIFNHWWQMIENNTPNYLIIDWIAIRRYHYKIIDADQHFLDVLRRITAFNYNQEFDREYMDVYPVLTRKKLEEILYTLMAGKTVNLSELDGPKPYLK